MQKLDYRGSLGVFLPKKKDSTVALFDKALNMITNQTMAKASMAAETIRVKLAGMYGSLQNRH